MEVQEKNATYDFLLSSGREDPKHKSIHSKKIKKVTITLCTSKNSSCTFP